MKNMMEFKRVLQSFDKMLSEKNPHPKDDKNKVKEMFKTFIEPCHPFVFLPERRDDGPIELEMDSTDEIMDLPYPCVHIEVKDSFISVPKAERWAIDGMSEFTPSYVGSFIVRETGPREYRFLMNMFSKSGQPIMIEATSDSGMNDLWKFANSLLKVYLERINKEKIGIEKQNGIRKLGQGNLKRFYKLRPITYVSPKKYQSEMKASEPGKTIDWSHRWEVRGHWRIVKGIGKDRDGNYTVMGFTWVNNFVKGPEKAPLIKKTYIVEGE
jgi:hypothetical protein